MASATKNNTSSKASASKKNGKKGKKVSKKIIFHGDAMQTQFLVKAGNIVSKQAIREAKALGLEIMYIENGILYREKDGKREKVSTISEAIPEKYKKLKKGVTLYVKK